MKLDLKEWLAKVTGQTEFKTLLWTNPIRIYGIRYVGGVVRKLLKALKPLTLGRGWAA